jgi:hypothetical protein
VCLVHRTSMNAHYEGALGMWPSSYGNSGLYPSDPVPVLAGAYDPLPSQWWWQSSWWGGSCSCSWCCYCHCRSSQWHSGSSWHTRAPEGSSCQDGNPVSNGCCGCCCRWG